MSVTIERSEWMRAPRRVATGRVLGAFGDVHGHLDQLNGLLDAFDEELDQLAPDDATIIGLGDVNDRGPHSIGCVDRLRRGLATESASLVSLRGNHEDKMLSCMETDDSDDWQGWLYWGGSSVLDELGCEATAASLSAAGGGDRDAWLRGQPIKLQIGQYYFAHAGIHPDEPLEKQTAKHLMWIRQPFLSSPGPFDQNVCVIHGHTPRMVPDWTHLNRINLDSGVYQTGLLTGLLLVEDRMRVIQVRGPALFQEYE